MKFDVVIPTLNSEKSIQMCVESVLKYIDFNKIIICDGYSKDKTISIVKSIVPKAKLKIIFDDKGLAKAREILCNNANTDWFLSIDADIVLKENTFREMQNYCCGKIGAVSCISKNNAFFEYRDYLKRIQMFNTHCVLIRRVAVENAFFPIDASIGEDEYLRKIVINNGFVPIQVPVSFIDLRDSHFESNKSWFQKGFVWGKYDLGFFSMLLIEFLKNPITGHHRSYFLGYIKGKFEKVGVKK